MADLKTGGTSYPVSIDSVTLNANGQDEMLAEHYNGPAQAIVAIETELGTGLRGLVDDLATRLNTNMSSEGGLLYGSSFPVSPFDTPHFFWRTDLEKLYLYDLTLASYSEIATSVSLADYITKSIGTTITAVHQFNPTVAGAPFTLGANGQNQRVTGLAADAVWDGSAVRSGATASTASTVAIRDASGNVTAKQFISDVAIGTPPLVVTSTTEVPNLRVAAANVANNLAPTEGSSVAATPTTQVNLGTLTAGDRILIHASLVVAGATPITSGYGYIKQNGGTGTAKFTCGNVVQQNAGLSMTTSSTTFEATPSAICQIMVTGTVTLESGIVVSGGSGLAYSNSLNCTVFRKQ